ncbi:TIGR02391 family protein [uncultured Methanomethylovorans sp.]|uniref:TIGR02391 family protein n=1 Tax=uncultured Methanomethylovorans sp. TaxID=183759 RepID=UPI002AA61BBB|nr:TIGR02391 family protein [uncultured Methanomethylovorans sp.]
MDSQSYRLLAIQIGDILKDSTTLKEIDRAAKSIFSFDIDHFPNDSITSQRGQRIHDWILTLAKQRMPAEERNRQLSCFLELIVLEDDKKNIFELIKKTGFTFTEDKEISEFQNRNFHPEILKNCKPLYLDGHYFHAVFEAAKIYHQLVQEKSHNSEDGQKLMLNAWDPDKGTLKVTKCVSVTDKNVQQGIAFLSAGLMRAVRNPTAHEPAHLWPISKEECLDILSFISFLLKKLDEATYFNVNT